MKERKNNVNTLLWLMVTLSVMVVFLTLSLSSCNSSVNPDSKGDEVTVRVASDFKNGKIDSIKVNSVDFSNKKEFTVKYNDIIEFKAKPDDGYKVVKWTPGILKVSDDKLTAKMTVTKDMKDLTVSIKFEKGNNPPGPNEKEPLTVDALRKELMVKDEDEKADKDSIVTSLYGLGLIRDGNNSSFKYQMLVDSKVVAKTGEELIQMMKDIDDTDYVKQSKGPNLGDKFKTLHSILEAKWNFAKNSDKIVPKESKMLTFNEGGKDPIVGLYELLCSSYYISYRNGELYVEVTLPGTDYFADWTFAFVKSDQVYVFSVGEIGKDSEGKMIIKPYLLRDVRGYKIKGYKYLPILKKQDGSASDSESYSGMPTLMTRNFNLVDLLIDDVQRQISSLLNHDSGKYVLDKGVTISVLSEKFIKDMLETCDVYMTIGDYYNPNGKVYTNRGSFRRGWRNVLKLTEHEFWGKCFTN